MESNLLLEQYSRYKKISLEESPYRCLLNTNIDLNPHQVNAFCATIQAVKTGGMILADEVGLGKTIEAGLVLNYMIQSGVKKILIVLPATLRKQWEIELDEKFNISTLILDRLTVEKDKISIKRALEKTENLQVVITSYHYSSKLIKKFPSVKWDFIVIDEAHNLRNVFHGTKRAKNLYELSKGIPKILLTATPLQNSLSDLHGIASFVDPRIFGTEKAFNKRYIEGQDYTELRETLKPVLYRTLRKDVGKYMAFSERKCKTIDFKLKAEEKELYDLVNDFLKRNPLYSIPSRNKGLIILVIRKLLASSSYALIETFEVFKNRLEKMYQGTKSAKAQEGFDLFWDFVEDEIEETDFDDDVDEETEIQKQEIQEELVIVRHILDVADRISSNAKIEALKIALQTAFEYQNERNILQKAVVFTESKRTQKYMAEELRKSGYREEDIVLFNGDFDDSMTKEIFRAWQIKNFGNVNYGKSVEYKHAIVDYFKNNAKILIVTDAGSEGLNLQFCNTVINYDLPWNPQKIEQRIGRCHRYGQKYNVVAINLLNTDNEADRRVYEILSKKFELFDGVFGASDVALGVLESGTSFEQTVLDIYQSCNSKLEIGRAFDKLDNQLEGKMNQQIVQLRSLLLTESPEAKGEALDETKANIDKYLAEVEYWSKFPQPEMDGKLYYWENEKWGQENFGSNGNLFIGAFCDNGKILFPVLLLCDEQGNYIDFEENDLVQALEKARDEDVKFFKPTESEKKIYSRIYSQLSDEMYQKYIRSIEPIKNYNKKKLDNWFTIQIEQTSFEIAELDKEIQDLFMEEAMAIDLLQKKDLLKKIQEKKIKYDKLKDGLPKKMRKLRKDADDDIENFNKQFEINPVLLVNIVLKF